MMFRSCVARLYVCCKSPKQVPFMYLFQFWKQEKFTGSKTWWTHQVFHDCDLLVGPQNASLIRLNEDGHCYDKKNPPLGPHNVFHNALFLTVQNIFVEVSADHNSWCMIPSVSNRTINIIFDLEHNILAISYLSDELTGHWRLHPLGLESYWNIHDSSLVMTLVKMFISFQFIQQGQWRFCFIFWSSTAILGTIFTYILLMYNSSS